MEERKYMEERKFMDERQAQKNHKLVVNNRKTSMVTGVLDVLSFDLNEILLETEMGMLMIKGSDLHVNRLSVEKGEVDLSGNIDSIAYSSVNQAAKSGENFLAKLFK
jgi:sporulation protein YabP